MKEVATADAEKQHCTDVTCFGQSGCRPSPWGDRIICQEDAQPALSGYKSNPKARSVLKKVMRGMLRHSPYAELPPANEDDLGWWDNDYVPGGVLFWDEATVPWDLQVYYATKYCHLSWCRCSCDLECNPANKKHDFVLYVHDYSCTSGCRNRCVKQYQIQKAMKSAMASAKVSALVAESGSWGTLSPGDKVGGWGRSGEQQQNYGWGTGASSNEQSSSGWGTLASGNQSSSGWGTLASSDNMCGLEPQDVPKEGAHYESAACSAILSAGIEIRVGNQAQSVNDQPQEHKDQYLAVWQFNMVVLDTKVPTWEGASYSNLAAGSESSLGIRRVESSAEGEAAGASIGEQDLSGDASHSGQGSLYYAPTDASSASCYGDISESVNSSDQTLPYAATKEGSQASVDSSVVVSKGSAASEAGSDGVWCNEQPADNAPTDGGGEMLLISKHETKNQSS